MIKLGHIELFVQDPGYSLAFYRDLLGFTVTTIQAEQFVWLQLGTHELLLRPGSGQNKASAAGEMAMTLVLYTDALAETVAYLTQHGVHCQSAPDGCYLFTDPDGHWFQLVDPQTHQ